jgi:DNA-binding Lrp family transcriptional regulator
LLIHVFAWRSFGSIGFIPGGSDTPRIGQLNSNPDVIREGDRMERMVLDKTDLNILAILARDCRTSYSKIGSLTGLTPKSVKARVKNMVSGGVIERFMVRVNPGAFGYRTANVVIKTNNRMTKDDAIRRVMQFGDLAFHAHQMGRIAAAGLLINKSLDVMSLNDCIRPATVDSVAVVDVPISMDLSETDLRIIKMPAPVRRQDRDRRHCKGTRHLRKDHDKAAREDEGGTGVGFLSPMRPGRHGRIRPVLHYNVCRKIALSQRLRAHVLRISGEHPVPSQRDRS